MDDKGHFDVSKIASMTFPVIVAAITWLISGINTLHMDVQDIKGKMPLLITPQGIPTDSPISADARYKLRDEMFKEINDLRVRVRLLEAKVGEKQ
jgi:hypothetical protein